MQSATLILRDCEVSTSMRPHISQFVLITVVLWSGCFAGWLGFISDRKINPYTWLDCKLMYFLLLFSVQWSSCLLAVMCIEKFFALYFPLKTRSICTVAMAKKVTFGLTLILEAINLQNFFIWEADVLPNGFKCCKLVNVPDNYVEIYIQIDYTLYSYGPFTVMLLANGAIIYKFMRASCASNQGGTESTNQALSKSAKKGTAMLITVSIMFIILTGPIAAIDNSVQVTVHAVIWAIVVLLRFTNNSINAVLYCVSGTRFRNELMKTFPFRLCKKNTNLRSGSQSVSSLTGNTTRATFTSNGSVTASPK